MPVYRLAANSIARSFKVSGKRHLLLTGSRGSGKTTLLRRLVPLLCPDAPALITTAYPADRVELREDATGKTAVIGRFDPSLPARDGNRMRPVEAGFLTLGVPALQRMAQSPGGWAVVDELGYLESGCASFQQAVENLLAHRRVLAVVRSQSTPFLDALRARPDAFVVDLDAPVPPLGCVVMASGQGKRFGANKLLADFGGRPLVECALQASNTPLLAHRIVVTRWAGVQALCREAGVPVLRHALPLRSDTVRLGLTALQDAAPGLAGCLFLPGDQPLLSRETLDALALAARPDEILRLCSREGVPGSPVLFGRFFFPELLALPAGSGGSAVLRAHPEQVRLLPAPDAELQDADTPAQLQALLAGSH